MNHSTPSSSPSDLESLGASSDRRSTKRLSDLKRDLVREREQVEMSGRPHRARIIRNIDVELARVRDEIARRQEGVAS